MKNVIAFAAAFAFASAAFAGSQTSSTESSSKTHMSDASSSSSLSAFPAQSDSSSMSRSSGVSSSTSGGASVMKSGVDVAASHNTIHSANVKRINLPQASSTQSGATKTRCVTRVRGNIEEKVCQFVAISNDEANAFFAQADAEARTSKLSK